MSAARVSDTPNIRAILRKLLSAELPSDSFVSISVDAGKLAFLEAQPERSRQKMRVEQINRFARIPTSI
jgi:uracil phosphoribosyltransferase